VGEPTNLSEKDLAELVTAAEFVVRAVEDDEPNPIWSPFGEQLDELHKQGRKITASTKPQLAAPAADSMFLSTRINILQDAVVTLVKDLDLYALAIVKMAEELRAFRKIGTHEQHLSDEPGTAPFVRHKPIAGEVLPPEQRATWAQGKTEHDK
jgi:hypothetical protein